MTVWFADTYYFLALGNPSDPAHAIARHYAALKSTLLVTTAWVVTELADALSSPVNRQAFLSLCAEMRDNPAIDVLWPTVELFQRGLDLYDQRPDKSWSLTDCISFIVMEDRGIVEALTGDHHFEQAGFRALMREG